MAVIDTNVLVSGVLTKNELSPTHLILEYIYDGTVTPMLNDEILKEYSDVLNRKKFHLPPDMTAAIVDLIRIRGKEYARHHSDLMLPDIDDKVFYETYLSSDKAYLVTGNLKHYPKENRIMLPSDFVQVIHPRHNGVLNDIQTDYSSRHLTEVLDNARKAMEHCWTIAGKHHLDLLSMEEIDYEIKVGRNQASPPANSANRFRGGEC
ncbi:MAG: putative toxin-antitoxin system toxin component, PIN family [Candidatus Cryptobacteroides sp.]